MKVKAKYEKGKISVTGELSLFMKNAKSLKFNLDMDLNIVLGFVLVVLIGFVTCIKKYKSHIFCYSCIKDWSDVCN